MNVRDYNREAWNREGERGNEWTVPVAPDVIDARRDQWEILLTENRSVPRAWFPDLWGADVLCLTSGGVQQGPVLAAAGANVRVLDKSQRQLAQDHLVAGREGLDLRIVEGDMADLSRFADESFELVFHSASNLSCRRCVLCGRRRSACCGARAPFWPGFINPTVYIFDLELVDSNGEVRVRYTLPYADATSTSEEVVRQQIERGGPLEFSHTLEDQIGGQIDAGFVIAGFYEDRHRDDSISAHMLTYFVTWAIKQ
jgi:hypothetical protein